MRVLLTTDTVGGVWTFTRELSEGLLALGHDVALVSFGRAPVSSQSAWLAQTARRWSRSFDYQPCDVPLEWMQENDTVFASGDKILHEVIRRFSPDIFHSSQFCWGALKLDLPKVITAHSDVMSWAAAAKPDLLNGSGWLDRYRNLVQRGLDGADAVVAPTRWMHHALRQHLHVNCRSEVIYNGRTMPACDTPERQRKLQAVTAGRLWDEAKGLSILRQITSSMPVMLAGEASFDGAPMALPSAVTFLGRLGETELACLLQQSSVYIAASVYEPFGLAPLEAALCGCAVLARNLDSMREVWGDAALYFKNAAELEALLSALSIDPDALHQAQLASSTRARQFTAERMTSSYLALYHSLLADDNESDEALEELVVDAL
jgi:glycosyltransferase involved in cell wall biosynthesis